MSKLVILLCISFLSMSSLWRNLQKMDSPIFTKTERVDGVNFYIHYPQTKSGFALIVSETIRQKFQKIHLYFGSKPQTDVHFVVSPADEANGLAQVIPYNTVYLNDFPPQKFSYLYDENWIENLVVHEYVHIVTMDRTEGLIDFLRHLFGSSTKVNGVLPRWVNEGVATWAESTFTTGGRLKKEMMGFELQKVLKNKNSCQSFDCLDAPLHYPFGSYPYWLGAFFMQWLENSKPNTIKCFYEDHANQVPFFISGVFERCYGENIEPTFAQFLTEFKNKKFYCPYGEKICGLSVDYQIGVIQKENVSYFALNLNSQAGTRAAITHTIAKWDQKKLKKLKFKESIEALYENVGDSCLYVTVFNGVEERKHYCLDENLKIISEHNEGQKIIEKMGAKYSNGRWVNNNKTFTREYKKSKVKKAKKYQPLHYMTPEYLIMLGNYFGNLSSLTMQTHLVDPVERHKVFLDLDYYPSVTSREPVSGGINYQFNQKNSIWSLSYNSFLSQNIGQDKINVNESSRLGYMKMYPDTWSQSYGWNFAKSFANDFISTRHTQSLSLTSSLGWTNAKITSFYQGFNSSLSGVVSETLGFDEFYGLIHDQTHYFYLTDDWDFHFDLNHAQYLKKDLYRGFFNGGGVSSFFTGSVPFEFYALPYGSMIGNRLTILRMQHEHNLSRLYWGYKFFPLYIKSLSALWGLENAQTDILLLRDRIEVDENVSAYHVGLAADTMLGYMFPARFELIYGRVVDPSDAGSMLMILMKASLF